jgi:hypothetical protein
MSAPTEAEIRTAVEGALGRSREIDVGSWVHELVQPIAYYPPEDRINRPPDCLWDNLRPSEAERLSALVEQIYVAADEWETYVVQQITERILAAGLTFASEFPDAPRSYGRPVAV